jgi:hypothetical protein
MLSKHRISRRDGSLSSESCQYYMDLLALDLNKERLLTILRVQLGSSSCECICKQDKPIASRLPKSFAHSIGIKP